MNSRHSFIAAPLVLVLPVLAFALSVGQKDDFEKGTVMGWTEGVNSPNPPVNIPGGGPGGVDDNYLKNDATGDEGAGGRMVMSNQAQWAGDYLTAGINSFRVDFEVSGGTSLTLRLGFEGGQSGTRFVTSGVTVPADRAWHPAQFDIRNMIRVGGEESVNAVLANVTTLRILAAESPSWQGDAVAATLCVDNITASADLVPVERVSWGRVKTLFGR